MLAVDEGTARRMGAAADGIYLSASYVTGIDSAANKTFLAAMQKKFGAELKTPNDLSVPEYEAVCAYKAAVEKAGKTDSSAVLKALAEPKTAATLTTQGIVPRRMNPEEFTAFLPSESAKFAGIIEQPSINIAN